MVFSCLCPALVVRFLSWHVLPGYAGAACFFIRLLRLFWVFCSFLACCYWVYVLFDLSSVGMGCGGQSKCKHCMTSFISFKTACESNCMFFLCTETTNVL